MTGRRASVAVALVILTGCGAGEPAPVAAPRMLSAEESYVAAVREKLPGSTATDAALLDAGRSVCADLSAGTPPREVYDGAAHGSRDFAAVILGVAVDELCTEHRDAVRALVDEL